MSLRLRLILILTGVVLATSIATVWVTARTVLAPFGKEIMKAHVDHVLQIADTIEAGALPEDLSTELGISIEIRRRPPARPSRRRAWRKHRCEREYLQDRDVIICHGPNSVVAVRTLDGWVTVKHAWNAGAPGERLMRWHFLIALLVLAVGLYVGALATRPLRTTRSAMAKVGAGDLGHRLPESGPKELSDLAREFNRMAERVAEMLRTERTLMAGISHELRTPLARLRLELELLREQSVPEKRVDAMENDLAEMDDLIGELLEISRLSLGERKLASKPVDLARVVADALERLRIESHDIDVSGTGSTVGDHERLVRVVTNLVSNAVKYTPGSGTIEIVIDGVSVTVKDRGPGVPPDALPRLFEPFYRARAAEGRPGMGLGLMIAQQVVQLHGGRIEARLRDGGGLEVQFWV